MDVADNIAHWNRLLNSEQYEKLLESILSYLDFIASLNVTNLKTLCDLHQQLTQLFFLYYSSNPCIFWIWFRKRRCFSCKKIYYKQRLFKSVCKRCCRLRTFKSGIFHQTIQKRSWTEYQELYFTGKSRNRKRSAWKSKYSNQYGCFRSRLQQLFTFYPGIQKIGRDHTNRLP